MRFLLCSLLLSVSVVTAYRVAPCYGADEARFLLAADLAENETSTVAVTLEVGGDLLVSEESGPKKLPLTVAGELRYTEQLLTWSADPAEPARSLREYETATAKIQVEKGGIERELGESQRLIVAEIRDGHAAFQGNESPLTREHFDLVNVVGNTLALNRLLPQREMAEGESWDHDATVLGTLLGMDHVAACEVRSVVIGCKHQQVQIRLAGTVHGTVDGAPTEMQLRGAYLFHQKHKRITKFNLAIQESRTANQIVPGLDVVAKVAVTVLPTATTIADSYSERARDVSQPLAHSLRYEAPQQGYLFLHDRAWYVTAEQSDLVSLRSLHQGNQTAHCNLTTLPARSEGRETTLEEFELDVRMSLGDNLETVTASTQWTTPQGHDCLGVVAQGKVKEVPIEWRYYLVASPGLPRVSLSVTIEQSQIEQFDGADRQIVDSLELLEKVSATASKQSEKHSR